MTHSVGIVESNGHWSIMYVVETKSHLTETIPESGILLEKALTSSDF